MEIKQYILMNKNTGELGLGVKLNYFDAPAYEQHLASMDNCSIRCVLDSEFDAWGVQVDDSAWLLAPKEMLDKTIECLGEL